MSGYCFRILELFISIIADTNISLLMEKISKNKKVPAKFASTQMCSYAKHSRILNTGSLACITLRAKQTIAD